ncbi:hypothetical protein DENSPDRAFT_843807 [Dentipellis sp. KUC8613]|nr:hypothetical protein DENSPDRAFT_843807 [Dentipellis sp. KUC8613]
MPKVIKVSQNKYQCPYAKCPTTCTSVHDVERHYWKHLPVRVKWSCTLCGGSFTRSYNATRHFRKAHRTEGPREGDIVMDWPSMSI